MHSGSASASTHTATIPHSSAARKSNVPANSAHSQMERGRVMLPDWLDPGPRAGLPPEIIN